MKKNHVITALLALSVQTVCVWGASLPAKRPNVLVITFDTTRADRLHCYGYDRIKTPSIDRLAREGTLFESTYAQAPQTLPNHTSIFTGLYTITHNVLSNGQKLGDEAITMAEILAGSGYRTGAIVAASPLLRDFNLSQGFATYNDAFDSADVYSGFKSVLRYFSNHKVNIPSDRRADAVANLAVQWLDRAAGRKKPFFLWVHFFDPHDPYVYRPDFEQPDVMSEGPWKNEHATSESSYLREIEFSDHYLGKILDHLDALGVMDHTLTVFTADHGESLGEHDYHGHRESVYDNVIRVPLIFRYPGHVPESERITAPAMSIDILPTVLSLLEIPYLPSSFQGTNLFTLSPDEPRKIFSLAVKLFTKDPIRRSMILGDFKFIEFDDPTKNALFNIRKDPAELNNLIDEKDSLTPQVSWGEEVNLWWDTYADLRFSDFQMTPEQMERLKSLGYVN